jgi:hypothetical protein
MTTEKNFPNGFSSWQETHYEVVQAITLIWTQDEPYGIVAEWHEAQGHGGLYELAKKLTDEFEQEYKDYDWGNIGYFETLENWLTEKLK